MNTFSHVPPGFRFHPTDEELVDYYLRRKVARRIDLDVIKDIDLYKIEPWDLQEVCKVGTGREDENEWYFFSHKDKKYPTGTRTNRATTAGFWKATGRDKAVYSKHDLIGMRKTLVFYKGRAPNGQKSDWIMHEYRLETDEINDTLQEEGWVVCRVFKKRMAAMRKVSEHDSPCWYDDRVSFNIDSPTQNPNPNFHHLPSYTCKKELDHLQLQAHHHHHHFLQLPLLETPKLLLQSHESSSSNIAGYGLDMQSPTLTPQHIPQSDQHQQNLLISSIYAADQVTDWRVLDKFVASQLSQEDDTSKENNTNCNGLIRHLNGASASTSSCQSGLWK